MWKQSYRSEFNIDILAMENHSMGEARTIKFGKGQIESPHYNANGENQGIVIN